MDRSFRVLFEKNAIRQLSKIDKSQQIMIYSYIEKNFEGTSNPRNYGTPSIGSLNSYWRYRVGGYRIIADINDFEFKIIIIEVGHRKDIYKKI